MPPECPSSGFSRLLIQPEIRLKPDELIGLYTDDTFIKLLAEPFSRKPSNEPQRLQIKGLAGSLDAVLASAIFKSVGGNHLYVLTDRDEAAYFFNDLQNLLGREVLLFPMSYKKPYQ